MGIQNETGAMAFHKQKQYDPTEAFLLNEREQKLLVLQLDKIDKLWYKRLKHLSRDRLDATTDLVRLEDEKQQLEYYDRSMEIHKMKEYNDECIKQMRHLKRELTHDNFNFDSSAFAQKRLTLVHQNDGSLCLPKIDSKCFVTQAVDKKNKPSRMKRGKSRRQSNLMKSKIFSMSDSNIDRVSKSRDGPMMIGRSKTFSVSQENLSDNNKVNHFVTTLVESADEAPGNESSATVLPTIHSRSEEHRSLKQKMATTLVLPTVTEVDSRQRKISV